MHGQCSLTACSKTEPREAKLRCDDGRKRHRQPRRRNVRSKACGRRPSSTEVSATASQRQGAPRTHAPGLVRLAWMDDTITTAPLAACRRGHLSCRQQLRGHVPAMRLALRRGRETHAARAAPRAPRRRRRACSSGSSSLVSIKGAVRFVEITSFQSCSVSSANGATTAARGRGDADVSPARRAARELTHAARTLAGRVVHEQVDFGACRRRGGRRPGGLQRRQQRLELPRRAGAALGGRLALRVRQQLADVALELRHARVQLGARGAVDADHGVALRLAHRVPRAHVRPQQHRRGKSAGAPPGRGRAAAWRGAECTRKAEVRTTSKLQTFWPMPPLLPVTTASGMVARVEMRTGRRGGSGRPV
jgi:hypothetical protein